MEKTIVRGMRAMPGDVLYKIVDPSVIWIEASVYEPDFGAVARRPARGDSHQRPPGRLVRRTHQWTSRRVSTPSRERRLCGSSSRTAEGASRQACSLRWSSACRSAVGWSCPQTPCSTRGPVSSCSCRRATAISSRVQWSSGTAPRVASKSRSGLSVGDQVAEGAAFFIDSESQLRAAAQGYAEAGTSQSATAALHRQALDSTSRSRRTP